MIESERNRFVYHHYAFALDLESILLGRALKIVLQHNRGEADLNRSFLDGRIWHRTDLPVTLCHV